MSATLDLRLASPIDTARLAFAIQASYESSHPIILRPGEYLNPELAITVVHAVIAKDDEGLIEHSLIRIDAEVDDQGHRVVTDSLRWPRRSMITVQVTLRTNSELSYEQLTSVISDPPRTTTTSDHLYAPTPQGGHSAAPPDHQRRYRRDADDRAGHR